MTKLTGYKNHVTFDQALFDGFCRGFGNEQRIQELSTLGYTVDDAFLNMYNKNAEIQMDKFYANQGSQASEFVVD